MPERPVGDDENEANADSETNAEKGANETIGAAAADNPPATWRPAPSFGRGGCVLLVGANVEVAYALSRALRVRYDVTLVMSITDALERMVVVRFDTILFDTRMACLAGLSVPDRLRVLAPRVAEPVVLIGTRDLSESDRARLTENRVECIDEPQDVTEIVRILALRTTDRG